MYLSRNYLFTLNICLPILAIISSGCYSSIPNKYSYDWEYIKSIELPINHQTSLTSYSIQSFENMLVTESRENNSIQFYDLNQEKLSFEIPIPSSGPNHIGKIRGFKVINFDTIFVVPDFHQTISMIDTSGTILKKFKLSEFGGIENGGMYSSTEFPLEFINESIYVKCWPKYSIYDVSPVGKGAEIVIIPKDSIVRYNIAYPSEYENVRNDPYLSSSRCINDRGNFVYSFPVSSKLIESNSQGQIVGIHDSPSFYENQASVSPFLNPLENSKQHFIENYYYNSIQYDKYNNLYYRIFLLPTDFIDPSTGRSKSTNQKEISLMILDSNFKVVGEHLLNSDLFNPRSTFITNEGLWISANNELSTRAKENLFIFKLFKPFSL